jgi:hypothetical protein
MIKLSTKYTPEIILIIYIILFFGIKKPYNDWDRVINSDGKGYYAYLTAIFIYDDLDYNFVDYYEKKYYPSDGSAYKHFKMPFKDDVVNKTFPGLAILWLPFFLLAHLFSYLFGFETDGYSILYQYTIGFATLFYLWLGFRFLLSILKKFGTENHLASFVLFVIAFGTNIIFYVIVEPSMAHIYSFALISGFLYAIIRASEKNKTWWWVLSAALISLIVIIRPTNGIFIFLIPFIAGSFSNQKKMVLSFFKNTKALFLSSMAVGIILSIPILLWYLQTGYFIVYSYGKEGFNFSEPHFFSILFSYNKGWFIYTPVAFISMFGFAGLFKENKFRFFVLLILLLIHIYTASSWWVWYYASKFSQRVFIDFYAILCILLAYLLMFVQQKKNFKYIIYPVLSILIFFNLFQFYQHYKWVYPSGYITKEIFWDSFSSTVPKARVNIPDEKIINSEYIINDFEKKSGWGNEASIADYKGNKVAVLNSENIYSVEFQDTFPKYFSTNKRIIKIGADILSDQKYSGASLVLDFRFNDKTYSYNPFYLRQFNKQNRWVHIDYAIYTPEPVTPHDIVKIYFFNGIKEETILIDNFSIEFISVQNEKSLIDKVHNSSSNF